MKIAFIGRVPLRFAETLQPELEQEHEVVAVASPSEAHVHEAFLKETEIVISPVLTPDLAGMLPGIRLFQAPMAGLDSVRLDVVLTDRMLNYLDEGQRT